MWVCGLWITQCITSTSRKDVTLVSVGLHVVLYFYCLFSGWLSIFSRNTAVLFFIVTLGHHAVSHLEIPCSSTLWYLTDLNLQPLLWAILSPLREWHTDWQRSHGFGGLKESFTQIPVWPWPLALSPISAALSSGPNTIQLENTVIPGHD